MAEPVPGISAVPDESNARYFHVVVAGWYHAESEEIIMIFFPSQSYSDRILIPLLMISTFLPLLHRKVT